MQAVVENHVVLTVFKEKLIALYVDVNKTRSKNNGYRVVLDEGLSARFDLLSQELQALTIANHIAANEALALNGLLDKNSAKARQFVDNDFSISISRLYGDSVKFLGDRIKEQANTNSEVAATYRANRESIKARRTADRYNVAYIP